MTTHYDASLRGIRTILGGLALLAALTGCGVAESIAEGFIDDQDAEIPTGSGLFGTLIRQSDGTDVALDRNVLLPGDRGSGDQALGVVAFTIDPSLQPDKSKLEWTLLRVWVEPGEGDVSSYGPIIVSHIPGGSDDLLAAGQVPNPPGVDIGYIEDVTTAGWRDVDVSQAFREDWDTSRSISAFVIRFTTPSDDDEADDYVDLDAEVGGEVKRAHLILHFGVNL
jgi:hypothetical protein